MSLQVKSNLTSSNNTRNQSNKKISNAKPKSNFLKVEDIINRNNYSNNNSKESNNNLRVKSKTISKSSLGSKNTNFGSQQDIRIVEDKEEQKELNKYLCLEVSKVICSKLEEIVADNLDLEEDILEDQNNTPFYCSVLPNINIKDFLCRLIEFCDPEYSTIVLVGLYVDRFCEEAKFHLTNTTIFRIVASAFIIAMKYNEDNCFSMNHYCKVVGVDKLELVKLEYCFLQLIEYDLFISDKLFNQCNEYLKNKNKNLRKSV